MSDMRTGVLELAVSGIEQRLARVERLAVANAKTTVRTARSTDDYGFEYPERIALRAALAEVEARGAAETATPPRDAGGVSPAPAPLAEVIAVTERWIESGLPLAPTSEAWAHLRRLLDVARKAARVSACTKVHAVPDGCAFCNLREACL